MSNAFAVELERFNALSMQRVMDSFKNATVLVQESLLDGSALTGAPGQPVRSGNLKNSFVPEFVTPTRWQITTNTVYAPFIEDGANDIAFFNPERGTEGRSEVGGYHSAKLTEASYADRIVPAAVAKAISNG